MAAEPGTSQTDRDLGWWERVIRAQLVVGRAAACALIPDLDLPEGEEFHLDDLADPGVVQDHHEDERVTMLGAIVAVEGSQASSELAREWSRRGGTEMVVRLNGVRSGECLRNGEKRGQVVRALVKVLTMG